MLVSTGVLGRVELGQMSYLFSATGTIAPTHFQEWQASAIDPAIIQLNLESLDDATEIDRFLNWHPHSRWQRGPFQQGWRCRGLDPLANWERMGWGCFKPDSPRQDAEGKALKYEHPKGEATRAFFLAMPDAQFWQRVQADAREPIVLVEGAKKAGALLSLGYAAISLPGIFNGRRKQPERLIPELLPFVQSDRPVYFCFDYETKPATLRNVNLAILKTGRLFEQAGCAVQVIHLPGPEKGVDDFIGAQGAAAFQAQYEAAQAFSHFRARLKNSLTYEPALVLNQRYLGDYPSLPETLIGIRSAKGTGKTESLKRLVGQAPRVLLIGHRVALLRNLAERLGLWLYSAEGVHIERVSKLAITLDSLYKLNTIGNRYDLVIIDEVEQALEHLAASDTCKAFRDKVLAVFEYFIRSGTRVVVADADLSDVALDYLSTIRNHGVALDAAPPSTHLEQPFVLVNEYQNGGRTIRWFEGTDASALIAELKEQIAGGDRPYVFTDSKHEAKRLYLQLSEAFPDKQIHVIHGDNSGEEANVCFVQQINQQVRQVDVLITTPTLGTGVSIDVEHFTQVYGIIHGGNLSATELSQGLFRVRPTVPMAVWVCNHRRGGYRESNPKRLQQNLLDCNEATGLLLQIDPQTGDRYALNEHFLKLWCEQRARKNASLNTLRESLAELLQEEGHTLTRLGDRVDLTLREEIKTTSYRVRDAEAQAIAQAADLSSFEAEVLEYKDRLTEAERQQLEKRRIQQSYGMRVTPDLVKQDNRGRLIRTIAALDDLLADPDVAKLRDLKERENYPILTDWRHYSLKRAVRERLGLLRYLDPDREFSNEDLEPLGEMCRACRYDIKAILNLTIPANASNRWILGVLLDQLGLKLLTRWQGARGQQQKLCRIDPDAWAFAKQVIAYRQNHRTQASPPANQPIPPSVLTPLFKPDLDPGGDGQNLPSLQQNSLELSAPEDKLLSAKILEINQALINLGKSTELTEPQIQALWDSLPDPVKQRIQQFLPSKSNSISP